MSKFKIYWRFYTDIYTTTKTNAKPIKKVFLLNLFLNIIKKKRALMSKYLGGTNKMRFSKRKANKIILPILEEVLDKIPPSDLNKNRKGRIYKFIRRKGKQLFASNIKLIPGIVEILHGRKLKPISRKTTTDTVLKLAQLLQRYYGNMKLKTLKKVIKNSKIKLSSKVLKKMSKRYFSFFLYYLLESKLDSVLVRTSYASSFFEAREIIKVGNVFVNGKCVKNRNHQISLGDVIFVNTKKDFYKEHKKTAFCLQNLIPMLSKNLKLNKKRKKKRKMRNQISNKNSKSTRFSKNRKLKKKSNYKISFKKKMFNKSTSKRSLKKLNFLMRNNPKKYASQFFKFKSEKNFIELKHKKCLRKSLRKRKDFVKNVRKYSQKNKVYFLLKYYLSLFKEKALFDKSFSNEGKDALLKISTSFKRKKVKNLKQNIFLNRKSDLYKYLLKVLSVDTDFIYDHHNKTFIVASYPRNIKYPFKFTMHDFRKISNFLN